MTKFATWILQNIEMNISSCEASIAYLYIFVHVLLILEVKDLGGVFSFAVRENGGPKRRLVSPLSVKRLR